MFDADMDCVDKSCCDKGVKQASANKAQASLRTPKRI